MIQQDGLLTALGRSKRESKKSMLMICQRLMKVVVVRRWSVYIRYEYRETRQNRRLSVSMFFPHLLPDLPLSPSAAELERREICRSGFSLIPDIPYTDFMFFSTYKTHRT